MYRLEFEIPGLPPTENGHKHWAVAGKLRKEWRKASMLKAIHAGQWSRPKLKSVRITATRFSTTEPDRDNLSRSFKSVIDGLVDAGVIQDDKPSIVKELITKWEKVGKGEGKIKIVVEEL